MTLIPSVPQTLATTYRERLAATGEITHKTTPMRAKQRGLMAWELDGALAERWEHELLILFGRICRRGENYAYIHGRKFLGMTLRRSLSIPISYHCYFLSSTDDVANSYPAVVIKCWQLSVARKAVEVLENDTEIKNLNLGFVFHADDDTPRLSAGDGITEITDWDDYNDFDSVCGARMIVTSNLPATRYSSYRQATAGGAIVLNNKYYLVTCAHIFDEIEPSETEEEAGTEADNDDEADEPLDALRSATTHEDFYAWEHILQARMLPKTHALYLESTKHLMENDGREEDSPRVKPSPKGHRSFLGHFMPYEELIPQERTKQAADRVPIKSQFICRALDWALSPIADSRYFQVNSWRSHDRELICARSVYALPHPPNGAAVTLSGASGVQSTNCSGGVAGITFPWSDIVQKVWTIEYLCCKCGTFHNMSVCCIQASSLLFVA
jgi:hypothetical protein